MKKTGVILVMVTSFIGCTKKTLPATAEPEGLAYYPLTQGRFIIYDVDSTVFTEIPKDTITYRYRIREKLADAFTDNLGQPARRLERYIKKYDPSRSYDSSSWTLKEVWMVNASNTSIQVVEGNVRYTKLIFPVIKNSSWDGNAGNTLGPSNYFYEYTDTPEKTGGFSFEKVLKVNQRKDSTAITYRKYAEKYADGVGLVFREITDVHSNAVIAGKPVVARIEYGIIYKQTLVTYGYEK